MTSAKDDKDSKKAWFSAFWRTFRRRSIPTIVRTRVILYASVVKLNSVRTFLSRASGKRFGSSIA